MFKKKRKTEDHTHVFWNDLLEAELANDGEGYHTMRE